MWIILSHWLPWVPHWRVKSSGVRQSKILSLAGLSRFGCQRVNGDIVFQWVIKMKSLIWIQALIKGSVNWCIHTCSNLLLWCDLHRLLCTCSPQIWLTDAQGPVVQKPINANPGLKVNQWVYFSTHKCCSTLKFGKTLLWFNSIIQSWEQK